MRSKDKTPVVLLKDTSDNMLADVFIYSTLLIIALDVVIEGKVKV